MLSCIVALPPCPHTESVCRRDRKPNKEEAFLLQLLSMPLLKQRLLTVRALRSLATALAAVSLDIDVLGNACADVHASLTSGTLKSVLLVTLTAGNFLNSGTSKAKARAFRVQDLLKLKTVKGRDGCPSLLHYVAKHMLQSVWLWSDHGTLHCCTFRKLPPTNTVLSGLFAENESQHIAARYPELFSPGALACRT